MSGQRMIVDSHPGRRVCYFQALRNVRGRNCALLRRRQIGYSWRRRIVVRDPDLAHRWTMAGDKDLAISDVLNDRPAKNTEKGASRMQKRRERSCTFAVTRCVSLALR